MLSGLKTQFPTQFEKSASKKFDENKLGDGDKDDESTVTKEEFSRMGYASRVKLRETNPTLYSELTK